MSSGGIHGRADTQPWPPSRAQPCTSSAISSRRNGGPLTSIVVTQLSRQASRSSRTLSFGPDQVDVLHHRGGHVAGRLVLAAGEVGLLDLLAGVLVAEPGEHVLVEVAVLGAHAADVEGQRGPQQVGARLDVVAHDGGHHAGHLEGVRRLAGARAGEALGQRVAVEAVGLRREEHRQPAVADLRGQGHVLRALGAEVDRDVGAQRPHDRLQRLAEARCRRRGASGSARPRTRPACRGRRSPGRCRRTRGCGRAAWRTPGCTSPPPPAGRSRRGRG